MREEERDRERVREEKRDREREKEWRGRKRGIEKKQIKNISVSEVCNSFLENREISRCFILKY